MRTRCQHCDGSGYPGGEQSNGIVCKVCDGSGNRSSEGGRMTKSDFVFHEALRTARELSRKYPGRFFRAYKADRRTYWVRQDDEPLLESGPGCTLTLRATFVNGEEVPCD